MRALSLAGLLGSMAGLGTCFAVGGRGGLLFGLLSVGVLLASLGGLFLGGGDDAPGRSASAERRFLAGVVGWAFLARVATAAILHLTGTWEYLGGDEGTFHDNGRVFALWVDGQVSIPLSPRFLGSVEVGYFYLVGAMYSFYWVGKLPPLLVNALLGAALVLPIHAMAGRFAGRTAARRAALLVAFFPSLILWSSLMVRDVVALFCLAAALHRADRIRRSPSIENILLLALLLAAMATLRTYIFLILGVSLAASFVIGQRGALRSAVVGGAVVVGMVLAVRFLGVGQSELERANLETLAMHRHYNALGPSVAGSLGSDVDISTPTAALTYLPVGLAYFYLSPLPWQIGSPRQVLSIPDLLVWYAILPSVFGGMAWLLRRRFRSALPILFTVVGISVLYALVEGNIGIIFRHRAQIIVPLCAVAGVGAVVRARARRRKESRPREGPVPLHAAPGRPLREAPGLRIPARTA